MAPGMNAPLYSLEILRLAASLPEPRPLPRVDGEADKRSPVCGSVVRTAVQVEGGRLAAMSQQVSACAFGQASAALLAGSAAGKNAQELGTARGELADWLAGTRDDPGAIGSFVALEPARSKRARHAAILLPFDALIAAMAAARE